MGPFNICRIAKHVTTRKESPGFLTIPSTLRGVHSRLATLSSTHDAYLDALRSLGGLYAKRGYPLDLVKGWLRKYSAERWNKRLNEEKDSSRNEVLVLKSEFNTSWNYFSASQLGDTIIRFWRESLLRAERNE